MGAVLAPRCSRWAPGIKCASRREAQSRGEFWYSLTLRGWVLGEDRMIAKVLRDEKKATFVFHWCPWCGGALPDVGSAVERLAEEDDGN